MSVPNFKLFSFRGNFKILHMTWMAFFISFLVWFNHAPLMIAIAKTLSLSQTEINTILILNIAITVPARILIGILVDKFGPKRVYSTLLLLMSIPCFMFAIAKNFEQLALSRFLLGFVGAGFVVGIRMVGEWFPARQVGLAEGIYGGWGNFGSAAAAFGLPLLAYVYGGEEGWRYAIGSTGIIAAIFGIVYFLTVSDTPKGSTYYRPKRTGALEVSNIKDLYFYMAMNLPIYGTLSLVVWKLSPAAGGNFTNLISHPAALLLHAVIWALYTINIFRIYSINRALLEKPVPDIHKYKFNQVAILNLTYLIAFGSELAVISMLPMFFFETFKNSHDLSLIDAGLLGGCFALVNLVARPFGGWFSDNFGRKASLTLFMAGMSAGYFLMSLINQEWTLFGVVFVTMSCACFVSGGCGAVFAIVPLIKRRLTGQIAGMVGAYGTIGGVLFLTVLSFVTPSIFFLVLHWVALLALFAVRYLDDPQGHMIETKEDGTVEMIEVG